MSLLAGLKAFFSFEGVASSALKIVDKIAGTDWTPKEKADWVLRYQEATKHQSPARRFIAIAFTLGMALFGFVYLSTGCLAYLYVFFSSGECDPLLVNSAGENISCLAQLTANQNLAEIRVKPLMQLQNDSLIYMRDVINNPMTVILGFYFFVDLGSKFKK